MDKHTFLLILLFMAGAIAGYITAPLTNYFVYWLVYEQGNKLLGWLYKKGILK